MPLTTAQAQQLKTDITVTRATVIYRGQTLLEWWTLGEDQTLASFYNEVATPTYLVWRTTLALAPLFTQDGFDWTRVDNLSVSKSRILEYMVAAGEQLNFAMPETRSGIEAAFAVVADAPCRQAIYTGAVRLALTGEQLFATGTGQPPTDHGQGAAVMGYEGSLSRLDIIEARVV
jgi:hypothetical protein